MSLMINPDRVTAVLLPDGWHEVADLDGKRIAPGVLSSFETDAYEYYEPHPNPDRNGHLHYTGGTGFTFREVGRKDRMCGPMASIAAVRCDR